MRRKHYSKYLAVLMALVMVFQFAVVSPQYVFAEVTEADGYTEETEGSASQEALEEDSETAPKEEEAEGGAEALPEADVSEDGNNEEAQPEEAVTEEDLPEEAEETEETETGEEGKDEAEETEEPETAPEEKDPEKEEEPEEKKEAPLLRAEKTGTVLAFSSDVHNTSSDSSAVRLGTWIDNVVAMHGGIDVMGFCGDLGDAGASESNFWRYAQSVIDMVAAKGVTGVYTTGNHEFNPGNYSRTTNATKNYYKINQEALDGTNFKIYCLGSESSSQSYSQDQISALDTYLVNAGTEKPIIILTHFPLHYYSSGFYPRTTGNAESVIDTLNNAADRGQKIVFLWGHNHTLSDSYYDQIYAPGDSIQYGSSSSNSAEIKFYYGAAGCMSDDDYNSGSGSVQGKGLVITINNKNQLAFTYYDENGDDKTEGGTYTEQDPVPVSGITINTPPTAEVEAGRTIKLTATVAPADATVKTVSWSSNNTSVATVDASGKVRGVSAGTAVITASLNDTTVRTLFTDEIEITVLPRSSEEEYFVIMIGNEALSSTASSEMMSNSSGYEYHGLEAVPYSTDDPASYIILWTLEPVDGTENGYYIRSYNGDYLSASYVSNGRGYTGTLTGGDVQDVWIVSSGLEAWQGNGSYLQSTMASDNPRPADIYMTTRDSNNSVSFFTVGSSSNYKTSVLVEPEAIIEPVAVTGITVEPATLEIEAGKSAALTANVLPEDADDKTVTWTSSDETVVTVSNAGRVKGIAAGTATVTATTNDGGYSASCEVTVTPSSAPGIGYVITIGDYALSVNPSSDVLINSTNYRYEGLEGVPYTSSTELTNDILWLIEPTNGGYYIMSQDGQYLNAYYNATTNPTGCNAALKLDDTPDVWTFEGSLEDWVLSGSTLHSANADKYMTHEEGSTSSPLNLFTIRSTGESSSMIDPDNPAEVRYVETTAFADGRDYIVGVTKDGSSVYAIENITGTTSGNTGSATLPVVAASGNEAAYIVTDSTSVVWRYTSSNRYLANSSRYLSRSTSGTTYVPRASGSGSAVTYDSANKRFSLSYQGTSYYLTNSSGTFGLSTSSSSAAQVRLFEKATVYNFKYVVQFVANGVNYQSGKYATGEVPVYSGVTPTREETELYTFTFSGWSSDGGTTVYGPDDALPAVTGPVTYVAQFERELKPVGYTVTFETNGGSEIEPQTVMEGGKATRPENDPTKEGCYAFGGWYSDETLETEYDFDAVVTGDITIYAKWNTHHTLTEHPASPATCEEAGTSAYWSCSVCGKFFSDAEGKNEIAENSWVVAATGHTWGEPSYVWAEDNNSVTATRTCANDSEHVETETVNTTSEVTKPATCEARGETTYTATFTNTAFTTQTKTLENVDAIGHAWGEPSYVWAEDNGSVTATRICGDDPSHVETATVNTTSEVTKPATCEAKGETTYTATFTNSAFATQTKTLENVDMLGHTWGEPSYVWAEDNSSVTATRICATDENHVETETVSTTSEVTKPATCEAKGETTYTATFTNTAFTTQTKTLENVDALGHAWGEVSYVWAEDNSSVTATRICANDPEHVETETVSTTSEVTKPATCEAKGETTYTATFTNPVFEVQTKTLENIDMLGHAWGEASYVWAEDNSSVTATRICANDPEHVETETVNTTSEVTKPATCEAMGETTYTATFTNPAFEVQTRTAEDVSALGHAWGEVSYVWAEDNSSVTATRTCANDPEHVETETVSTTSEVTKPATCEAKGETTYTATFTNPAFEVQIRTLENIDAIGHDWDDPDYGWSTDLSTVIAFRRCRRSPVHVEVESASTTAEVTKPATCEEKGETTYTAVFENPAFVTQTRTEANIDALGHAWSEVSYVWAEDNCSVTATRTCANDPEHVETETVNTTSEVTKPATCEAKGETTYTAVFGNPAFETQTKAVEDIDALGHDFGEPVWTWAEDYSSATATFTCSHDETHTYSFDCPVESEEQEDGSVIHTARVLFNGIVYEDTVTEAAPDVVITDQDSTEGIELFWNEIPKATQYNVYIVQNGEEILLGTVTGTTYMHEDKLVMGETYTYKVVALNESGNEISSGVHDDFYNPFRDDLTDDDPRLTYIAWAYNNEIVKGTGTTTFNPDGSTTRMNFVMILYKMHGSPKVSGKNPFADVTGSKSVKAVLWAYNKGLVKGTDATHFSPDVNLSRLNIIMILYKLAGSPSVSGENPFEDISGSKTVKAVLWAVQKGIIAGVDDTHFSPNGNCSRALFVEVLYKYNEIYKIME